MSAPHEAVGSAEAQDPRVQRTRAHVLQHARALLAEGGQGAMTYSDLAARARVTRQTLYRHWPTREALFVDLALDGAAGGMPEGGGPPDTVIADFLKGMRAGMDDPSNAVPLAALIAQADHDPTSRQALMDIVADVRAALNAVLAPSGVALDGEQYAALSGPLLFQRFFAREPITDQLIERLVANWSASNSPPSR